MKRALILITIVAIAIAGFLSIRGTMPFMATFGTSMEPQLQAGDLIWISSVEPKNVEVGDIIVFTIPAAVREHYNYPSIIAHRVIKINATDGRLSFRTKGDNTGEDPFTVRPQDIRGQVSAQIHYLGFPLLFFQSQQGTMFIIIGLSLFALFLYADDINKGRRKVQRGIFEPIIEENQLTRQTLEQRLGGTEKGLENTQHALSSFALAIAEYAEHLRSHTSAIQGLAEASHELKKGDAEQNKVLARLLETMDYKGSAKPEEVSRETKDINAPPGCWRSPDTGGEAGGRNRDH